MAPERLPANVLYHRQQIDLLPSVACVIAAPLASRGASVEKSSAHAKVGLPRIAQSRQRTIPRGTALCGGGHPILRAGTRLSRTAGPHPNVRTIWHWGGH